ncbi:hypothetical protein M405DRAFT_714071, partial [Rhizopogon salebrosus TDB-379]
LIFRKGARINGKHFRDVLDPQFLVLTRNAFSENLFKFLFNIFVLFVVDLLHEFELGVWKDQLSRILTGGKFSNSVPALRVVDTNCYRYRNVPTFGRGTIRRFHKNASAMKKLAGRDFEDLSQV